MGLGLGLAITKDLIQLHGGTIEARSPGSNRGSTFILRLPMPVIRKAIQVREDELPAAEESLKGLKVLLVEDDASTQKVMQFVLARMGAEVLVTDSARHAIEKRTEFDPAVIVSDIGLPDMDGCAFIREIREFERKEGRSPTVSIAVSAFAREEDRKKALAAGFTQYFSKPLDLDKLIQNLVKLPRSSNA